MYAAVSHDGAALYRAGDELLNDYDLVYFAIHKGFVNLEVGSLYTD